MDLPESPADDTTAGQGDGSRSVLQRKPAPDLIRGGFPFA
jgi:hypothetical protein